MSFSTGDLVHVRLDTIGAAATDTYHEDKSSRHVEGEIVGVFLDEDDADKDTYVVALKMPKLCFYESELTPIPRKARKSVL